MKTLSIVLAGSGLLLTILPPVLFFAGAVELESLQHLMTFGMVLWFVGDLPRVIARRTAS